MDEVDLTDDDSDLNLINHIKHCCEQLAKISLFCKSPVLQNRDLMITFGYNLGKLICLVNSTINISNGSTSYDLNPKLNTYGLSMAQKVINDGLTDRPNYYQLIDYGFAIGFIKETFLQNDQNWWTPITRLCNQNKWSEVAKQTIKNLNSHQVLNNNNHRHVPVFNHCAKINWPNIYETILWQNAKIITLCNFYEKNPL